MSKSGAVIGITDETTVDCLNKKHRIIFILSNDKNWRGRPLKKVLEYDMRKVVPGKYFDDGRICGFSLIFPREEDLIVRKQLGNNSVAIYKLYHYGCDYFSDDEKDEYLSLAKKVLVLAKQRFVLPSKDTVYRFVRSQLRSGYNLGANSEARFGLEHFNLAYGLSAYGNIINRPEGFFRTKELTTEQCCRIIYSLVRMRHGLFSL